MERKVSVFILIVLTSVWVKSLTYEINTVPDEYHGNASFYGVQVTRRGELQTFQSYWDEVIVINLPQQSEYEGFLSSLDAYCNSMHTVRSV